MISAPSAAATTAATNGATKAAAATAAAKAAAARWSNGQRRVRAASIVSLTNDDRGRANGRHAAKRARVGDRSRNRAIRLQQNREASRKSRLRKKSQELELQKKAALYTRSNETLRRQNLELQRMLDLARSRVAAEASPEIEPEGGNNAGCHRSVPNPMTSLDDDSKLVLQVEGRQSVPNPISPSPQSHVIDENEVGSVSCDFIDLLLENDDWLDDDVFEASENGSQASENGSQVSHDSNVEANVSDVSDDDNSDYIDLLLENDSWLNDDEATSTAKAPAVAPQPRWAQVVSPTLSLDATPNLNEIREPGFAKPRQVVSPVLSLDLSTKGECRGHGGGRAAAKAGSKMGAHETRLEKNREAARRRRLKKKAEEDRLQQSVAFYKQSNEMLKRENEEYEMMILQARSKLAASKKEIHQSMIAAE